MGWWGMGKRGGISGILDAPRDDPRDMVMGDGPADIMDLFKDEILTLGWKPSKIRLQEAFGGNLSLIPDGPVRDAVAKLHGDLIAEWVENWEREPFPEELQGCLDFCFGV